MIITANRAGRCRACVANMANFLTQSRRASAAPKPLAPGPLPPHPCPMDDPYRPLDVEGSSTAAALLFRARHGALAVLLDDGAPMVTRVACSWDAGRSGDTRPAALILVSTLSAHTGAAMARPQTSLLVGEPGAKGDPLTHPRLTLLTKAEPASKPALRGLWLNDHPKAALYIDFTDFMLLRLVVAAAHLNGGFGKAYRLTSADLAALAPAPLSPPAT